jgi:hypothetical protein
MTFRGVAARLLAFAVATAFGWSLCVACAEAAIPTSAQMACCKDGELACAPHSGASDCCLTDSARQREVVAGAKIDPVYRLAAVVAWAVAPDMGLVDSAHTRTGPPPSRPHIEPGPPPCIAFSSLLI